MNLRFARKISESEAKYCFDKKHLVYCVSIKSKLDLYNNVDVIGKALWEWKQIHPLLRCCFQVETDQLKDAYFAYADSIKEIDSFQNVNLLLSNTKQNQFMSSKKIFDYLSELLTYRELNIPINLEKGELMWRLNFFSSTKNSILDAHEYTILFSINHAICDGRSGYNCLLHLISIIEQMSTNSYIEGKRYTLPLSAHDYLLKYTNEQDCYSINIPHIKLPKDSEFDEHSDNTKSSKEILLEHGFSGEESIQFLGGKTFGTLSDLIKIYLDSCSRSETVTLDSNIYLSIKTLCKKNKLKVNGFLNMVTLLATKLTYETLFSEDLRVISYVNPIDLRSRLNPLEEFKSMSCIVCPIRLLFEENFNTKDENWVKKFWGKAKQINDDFTAKIETEKIMFKKLIMRDDQNSSSIRYYYALTNIGVLVNSLTQEKEIEVTKLNISRNISLDSNLHVKNIFVYSLQNKMQVTVRYNNNMANSKYIRQFIENFLNIIKTVIL